MTDLERLKAFLDAAGVKYTETKTDSFYGVKCMEGDDMVQGYMCFYTHFEFTPDGKLSEMGAYE